MNDDLLVSWKDIAAYLKCSVRKAQRLEQRALPVNRIPGTKSVWASMAEIDRWLASHAVTAKTTPDQLTARAAKYPDDQSVIPANSVTEKARWERGRFSRFLSLRVRLLLLATLLVVTVAGASASMYGVAIVAFGVTAAFAALAYPSLPDSCYTRAVLGFLLIAGMSYCASAASLPDVIASVINMSTLRPALFYPFLTGLRFIPIPVLIAIMLVAARTRNDAGFAESSRLHTAYLWLGPLLLLAAAVAGLNNSGVGHIWQARLSIRWTLLAGELFVLGVNLALFVRGYRFLSAVSIRNYRQLLSWCTLGYLLVALTASIVNRHWNEIDKFYLDVRRPQAYRARAANAGDGFRNWLKDHRAEAGPDLVSLSNDPEFLAALQNQEFYKQDFDEAFQVRSRAVIFGYKNLVHARFQRPAFVRIRFPVGLAESLKFRPGSPNAH